MEMLIKFGLEKVVEADDVPIIGRNRDEFIFTKKGWNVVT